MTKRLLASTVGVGVLAFAVAGYSQTTPPSLDKPDAPAVKEGKSGATKRASGEVTSVDAKSGKLSGTAAVRPSIVSNLGRHRSTIARYTFAGLDV